MPAGLYPWGDWWAQGNVVLRCGVDYDCSQYMMVQQIYNRARRDGISVRVKDGRDHIVLEVLSRGGDGIAGVGGEILHTEAAPAEPAQ